jgi:hypothetical protein|tara:strand:+ start:452 stop:631 length:180 start_codon:yes stop_codon:yes gene_type:complete
MKIKRNRSGLLKRTTPRPLTRGTGLQNKTTPRPLTRGLGLKTEKKFNFKDYWQEIGNDK